MEISWHSEEPVSSGWLEQPLVVPYRVFYDDLDILFRGTGDGSLVSHSVGTSNASLNFDPESELIEVILEQLSVFGVILVDTLESEPPDAPQRLYVSMIQLHTQKRSTVVREGDDVEEEENLNTDFDRRGGGIPNATTD